MRPIKNRSFCPDCLEYKMSFETEKKAYRFIAYESENILKENGYCPIRAYKCPVCGCWHLTSEHLLEDCFDCECSVDREQMEISRNLLGLVIRNTHTVALNLCNKVKTFSQLLNDSVVDWERARIIAKELLDMFEKIWRTPYRYIYNVRKQCDEFFELCYLYTWRNNLDLTAIN